MLAKLTRRPIKVEGLELDRYEFEGKSYFLLEDMVWLLGDTARRCNVIIPKLQLPQYSLRMAVEGKGKYTRRLLTSEAVLLLCSASGRDVADAIYYELGGQIDRANKLPPRERPVPPPPPELPAKLPEPYLCGGLSVDRYGYKGLVYVLQTELEEVAGRLVGHLLKANPQLIEPPLRIRLCLADAPKRHARTLYELRTARSLLMLVGTSRCGELWTLINVEIERSRAAKESARG